MLSDRPLDPPPKIPGSWRKHRPGSRENDHWWIWSPYFLKMVFFFDQLKRRKTLRFLAGFVLIPFSFLSLENLPRLRFPSHAGSLCHGFAVIYSTASSIPPDFWCSGWRLGTYTRTSYRQPVCCFSCPISFVVFILSGWKGLCWILLPLFHTFHDRLYEPVCICKRPSMPMQNASGCHLGLSGFLAVTVLEKWLWRQMEDVAWDRRRGGWENIRYASGRS